LSGILRAVLPNPSQNENGAREAVFSLVYDVKERNSGKYTPIWPYLNPDNPLGREMMARQVARQFCRLGEVHSLVYGGRASGEDGRKLTVSTRVGLESRLTDYLG
jgi:hypothetical protein